MCVVGTKGTETSKYYIPLVMVIEAPDYEMAARRVDDITAALCNLAPEDLDGFTKIDNLEPIKTPKNWFSQRDIYINFDGEHFSLSLEAN